MSERKFKKARQVISVAELLEHEWFIVHFGQRIVKTMHKGFLISWQLRVCEEFVNGGQIYIAERLTNGEYYRRKSDEQLIDMLSENICDYCPLPEGKRGVHCYGGEPIMCEGVCCDDALRAWKEEYVE